MKAIVSKTLILIFSALLSTCIHAEITVDRYMALREEAIVAFHAQFFVQANSRLSLSAKNLFHNTQVRLQEIVGAVNVKGFPNRGEAILGTRDDGQYDGLDGVVVTSLDKRTKLFVATEPLLHAWLKNHQSAVGRNTSLSMRIGTQKFYNETSTISSDAAVYGYGDIHVRAKRGLSAKAIIFALGQDDPAPNPPQALAVTVMSDNRIYILSETITAPKITECKSLSSQSRISFEECYAEKLSSKPEYARLVDQAQGMVDRVGEKRKH